MGTIVDNGGSYLARWYVADANSKNGKRRVSKSFRSHLDAERHLAFVESGNDLAVLNAPLADALSSWIHARAVMGEINLKVAEREQNVADNFRQVLSDTTVLQCTLELLVKAFEKLKTGRHRCRKDGRPVAGLKPRTLNLHRGLLRRFFKQQVAAGRLAVDPSYGLAASRMPIVDALEPTDAQVAALVARVQQSRAANDNLLPLITLLEITGLRRGEALALTRDDLDAMRGTVAVTKMLAQTKAEGVFVKRPKSARGHRTLEVPRWYFDLLDAHFQRLDQQACAMGDAYSDHRLVFPDAF